MSKELKTPDTGIFFGIPAEKYFSWDCFSKSQIYATMKSAKHLKHYRSNDFKSDSMIIGSLVDGLLLEPNELDKYAVMPDTYNDGKGNEKPWNMNAKVCKETYQSIIDSQKTPIKQKVYDHADSIANAVKEHKTANEMIKISKKQISLVWNDAESGVLCKGRLDLLNENAIIDLKTTRNASHRAFQRDIVNLGYHMQAAMYLDGYAALNGGKMLDWYFIVVENEAPFGCIVYQLSEDFIECGRINYKIALHKYRGYLEDDPDLLRGYSECIEPMDCPQWALEIAYKEGDNVGI